MNVLLLSDCLGVPVSTDRAIEWTLAILDALVLLHGRGEVHGHLAPDLVRIGTDRGGRVFAVLVPFESMHCSLHATMLPSLYRAPEQCRGAAASQAADLYALGIMLHEMLTGRRPWSAIDAAQLLHAQLHEPLPALPAHARAFEGFVRRLAHKRPEARFNQARIAASALRILAASRSEIGVDVAPPMAMPKRRVAYPVASLTFAAALTTGTLVMVAAGASLDDASSELSTQTPTSSRAVPPMPMPRGTAGVVPVASRESSPTASARAPEFPPPPRVSSPRRSVVSKRSDASSRELARASVVSLRSYDGQRAVPSSVAERLHGDSTFLSGDECLGHFSCGGGSNRSTGGQK